MYLDYSFYESHRSIVDIYVFVGNLWMQKCTKCVKIYKISKVRYLLQYLVSETNLVTIFNE